MFKPLLLSAALGLALSNVALAQEEEAESPLSGNIALVSDYVFRGVSQTNEDPALQGGLTYSFDSGFYVGTWLSTVDFVDGDGADLEWDVFVGYATDLSDTWAMDLSFVRYVYPSVARGVDYDYNEVIAKFTYSEWLSFTAGLSNDVFNLDDFGAYYEVSGEWGLPAEFFLNAHVGYYGLDSALGEDYLNYGVGVTRDVGPVSFGLSWSDTNNDGEVLFGDNAGSRVYGSVTFNF